MNLENINNLIDELAQLRDKKADLNKQVKAVTEAYDTIADELQAAMKEAGLKKLSNHNFTVSSIEDIVANVEDWDMFYDYIHSNKAFYMLQRRVANAAYKELASRGEDVPGLVPFKKYSLSLRKI